MTIREQVLNALQYWVPYKYGATATQLCHAFKANGHEVSLSSLSSQLCKMVKDGELDLLVEYGPRGGNGYVLKGKR
jgi:hypothetical protein